MRNILLVCALTISCGGGAETTQPPVTPPTSATPSASSSTPSVPETPPVTAWKDMTKEQRGKYMKETVMPKMSALFQEYDAKHYEAFSCKTCHGDGAKEGTFKMPNTQLPKLPMDHNAMGEIAKKKPDAMKFMATKVKPEMAKLLGKEPWDEKTAPTGFGCMGCHEMTK